jgi:HD-like signal output (HDOD) protein
MAQTAAATNPIKAAIVSQVSIDEELWFGALDTKAAEVAAAHSMAAMAGRVIGAKPFPAAARRLAELAGNESTKIGEIVQVLEQDPALSAKLLRMVNSAGFALRRQCSSVRHAVTLVGSKNLYQMATTAAVLDLFNSESAHAVQVLEHSAVVAAFCRYLGVHLSLPAEELFTVGVLHDIGKLMLLETLEGAYGSMIDQSQGGADTLHMLERAAQGFDHGVLAAHVLKEWNIPDPIPKVVAWHHEPARAYASSSLHAALVQTLRLADALVHAMNQGASRGDIPTLAKHEAANYLDISEAQLDAMWEELSSLHSRTLAHTRGETDDGIAQDDVSRTRSRPPPKQNPAADLPQQFPCVQCGSPSFGAACPACKGYICPEHPVGNAGWCPVCASEYQSFAEASRLPVGLRRVSLGAVGLTLMTAIVGRLVGDNTGAFRGFVGGVLLSAFALGTIWIVNRTILRSRFVRSRPDRSVPKV